MATPDELLDIANRIGRLGDAMGWVGDHLVGRAANTEWTCAKADRYRAALDQRRAQAQKLAKEIYFLAYWAKIQSGATAHAGQPATGSKAV